MKRAIDFGAAFLACAILFPDGAARADDDEQDSSRAAAFSILEREAFREDPAAALSSSLKLPFAFPTDVRDDAVFGIDVSHHTKDNCKCPFDWSVIANTKVIFVYAKASDSNRYADPQFPGYWRGLENHPKIYRGAYHFMRPEADPVDQAKYFLAQVNKAGKLLPRDLPPGLDLEWTGLNSDPKDEEGDPDAWIHVESDEIIKKALKWLEYVERETGRIPIIYTSNVWWNRRIKDPKKIKLLEKYPIWISDYSISGRAREVPKVPNNAEWIMWQFSSSGVMDEARISFPDSVPTKQRIDVNIVPGTLENFRSKFKLPAIGPDAEIVIAKQTDQAKDAPSQPPNQTQTPSGPAPDANKPGDSAARSGPGTDSRPGPSNNTRVASVPDASSGKNAGDSAGSQAKAPPDAISQKTMIEIVLSNGRIMRVDASIDPVVLRRLIVALDPR